jgi:hypothetical protein
MPRGLHATTQTEIAKIARTPMWGTKAWSDRNGWLNFKAENLPVFDVSVLSYAISPGPLVYQPIIDGSQSLNVVGHYPQFFNVVEDSRSWVWTKTGSSWLKCTYSAGYMNGLLTATASAGSSVAINVDSTLGAAIANSLVPEMLDFQVNLKIYDGANSESVVVTAVNSATQLTVASLANTHTYSATNPIGISALPGSIKLACILMCVHLARERGVVALTMGSARGGIATKGSEEIISQAEYLMEPFVMKL